MNRDEFISLAVRYSQEMFKRDAEAGLPTLKVGEPIDPDQPAMLHVGLQFTSSKAVDQGVLDLMPADRVALYCEAQWEGMVRNLAAHLRETAEDIERILRDRHADNGDG